MNASSAEELAASAGELATKAEELTKIISFFNIKKMNYLVGTKEIYRKEETKKPEEMVSKAYQENTSPKGVDIKLDSHDSEFESY